jgi:hypothetical protein
MSFGKSGVYHTTVSIRYDALTLLTMLVGYVEATRLCGRVIRRNVDVVLLGYSNFVYRRGPSLGFWGVDIACR